MESNPLCRAVFNFFKTTNMHRIIIVFLILTAIPSMSHAQLGNTEQQDLARYGNPVNGQDLFPPILNNADTKAYNFQGWKIRAGYLNGHAVRISYNKISQPNFSPQLKEDEIAAILNAEKHGGKWVKLQPASLFSKVKSGNKLFDSAQLRWANTNNSIAYTLLGNMTIYIESPEALIWEQSFENQKEVRRKESIPQF